MSPSAHLSPRAGAVRSGHIDPRAVLIVAVGLAYATVLALAVATLLTPPRLSFALEVAAPGHACTTGRAGNCRGRTRRGWRSGCWSDAA